MKSVRERARIEGKSRDVTQFSAMAAGAPAWFGPAMAAALAPVLDGVNDISAKMNNKDLRKRTDIVQGIRAAGGGVPPVFPCTVAHLDNMTRANALNLYQLYNLAYAPRPTTTKAQILKKLLRHLGVPREAAIS